MPWRIERRNSRYCVIKEGESTPVRGGCHATRAEAVKHQRALYASEGEAAMERSTVMQMDEIIDVNGNVIGWTTSPVLVTSGTTNNVTYSVTATGDATGDEAVAEETRREWEGVLAVEGIPTSDGRYLIRDKIDHRELPLSLMAQTVTDEGHLGAFCAGRIDTITKEPRPDLGENAIAIIGRGSFSNSEEGQKAARLLDEGDLRGISIDFAATASYLLDAETHEVIEEEMGLEQLLEGNFLRGFEGKIMGATLCPFAAFEEATMRMVEVSQDEAIVASAFSMRKTLTASAAGRAPLRPPHDWFFQPEPDGPFPLTVMPDGRVLGHLAVWNQCHRSMKHSCELAPRSRSNYAFFHTGAITCDDGQKVNIGRITVGEGGHASVSPYLGTQGAVDHYDKTGMVGAFVRAVDGKYGIWLSGCVRSDAPAEKIRDMEANPPSGDWREENGRLELCAALSVPVAGFPVPRYEAALVASGEEERVVALVATGYIEPIEFSRAEQRRLERLKHAARKALAA